MATLGAAMIVAAMGGSLHADLLAGWSFNAVDSSAGSILADYGSGRLDFESISDHHDFFAGTEMNAWGDAGSGDALGFRGAAAESGAIYLDWIPTPVIGGGPTHLQCSLATRRSGTGSDLIGVDAWSGVDWVAIASITTMTAWSTSVFDLDDVHSGAAPLHLRFTLAGASNPQGTVRIDNLRIDALAVPAPGVLATMGLLVTRCGPRRRR